MKNKRHGDLAFTPTKESTENMTKIGSKHFTLALGETTGHSHQIKVKEGTLDIYKDSTGGIVLVIDGMAILTHEEHKPLEFTTGTYRMTNQREYDYFSLETTKVVD